MIWLIGGTKDSRIIAEKLLEKKKKVIVSTATLYGKKLLSDLDLEVIDKRLTEKEMEEFIIQKKIDLVIDASHPYAENVSEQAIKISKITNANYIRFEREDLEYKRAKRFATIKEIIEYLNRNYKEKNILSTLGSKNLKDLLEVKDYNRLFIRILPTTESIKLAEEMGYLPKNIIALQGPFSKEFNKSIIKNYKINFLITKESGSTGGELEKVEACKETGVEVLTLMRPKVDYPVVFNEIDELINYLM